MDDNKKKPEVGGQDAGYLFEFRGDGVYLTVYPTGDSGILFELSDMRQILKEYGVLDYDIELLAKAVRASDGTPIKLADHFEASVSEKEDKSPNIKIDPGAEDSREFMNFQVEFSKDRMKVTVRIDRQYGKRPPTKEMILEALSHRQVVYGIDEEAIERGLTHGSQFIAAQGTPPEAGKDAKIIKKFSLAEKGKPAIHNDRVDYKNMNLFVLAKKGQLLAERVPHTMGVAGTNVFGDTIKAKPGKPKPVPSGKNTEIRDENFVVSLIDGQIVDSGSKISVDPRFELKGDVNVGTGNVTFDGAVDIGGSVQEGFVVKATGDINIKGTVSGARIEGYNVYVSGGVQGMNKGIIIAQEDVRVKFIENGKIEAGGSIFVNDVALHSDLRAGQNIMVEGARGLVTGGYLAAGEEIRATTVGNTSFITTKLVVGVNPALQRRYQETCRSYAEGKKKLTQLMQALNTLGKIDITKLPQSRVEQISQLTRSQFLLAGQVERDEKLIRELEGQISDMRKGRIKVSDRMYPGCRVSINSVMKNVITEEQHCTFTLEDDAVTTGPY